jgi:hypothetical protein
MTSIVAVVSVTFRGSDSMSNEDPLQDLPDWAVLMMLVLFLIGAAIVLYF